ncbi:hypothetical protein GCM10007886_28760 [Methylobacterium gregans]|nr:hypothetical protein [Methylobacterium gregans]GLS54693.1 hypothetical protein GCM10007886_28760 [Methylobacterium gregans]
MVPSEAEIEARLAELRRRREAIDREIADHLLYLELGRRLRAGAGEAGGYPLSAAGAAGAYADPGTPGPSGPAYPDRAEAGATGPEGGAPARRWTARAPDSGPAVSPAPFPAGSSGKARDEAKGEARSASGSWAAPAARPSPLAPSPVAPSPVAPSPGPAMPVPPTGSSSHGLPPDRSFTPSPGPEGPPPPVSFEEDPAGARRYGRALVEAAVAVLAEAGRPMHAGEILEHLAARGFGVPGQDPVAALNTRLWKRSGPGGPLRRLGDAVYDRAGEPGPEGFGPAGGWPA